MDLPKILIDLVEAQNSFDSNAYTNCFAEDAVVFDEGNTHTGKQAIKQWIEHANDTYKVKMSPINYSVKKQVLKAEIAGNFPGSPLVLNYHFDIKGDQIVSLKIA